MSLTVWQVARRVRPAACGWQYEACSVQRAAWGCTLRPATCGLQPVMGSKRPAMCGQQCVTCSLGLQCEACGVYLAAYDFQYSLPQITSPGSFSSHFIVDENGSLAANNCFSVATDSLPPLPHCPEAQNFWSDYGCQGWLASLAGGTTVGSPTPWEVVLL